MTAARTSFGFLPVRSAGNNSLANWLAAKSLGPLENGDGHFPDSFSSLGRLSANRFCSALINQPLKALENEQKFQTHKNGLKKKGIFAHPSGQLPLLADKKFGFPRGICLLAAKIFNLDSPGVPKPMEGHGEEEDVLARYIPPVFSTRAALFQCFFFVLTASPKNG